jgi:hypothetical protein
MMHETLPLWFWVIYYAILLSALYFSVKRLITTGFHFLSILVIFAIVSTFSVALYYGTGYRINENEFEFLIRMVKEREFWAFYVVVSYIFVLYYTLYKWRIVARQYLTK